MIKLEMVWGRKARGVVGRDVERVCVCKITGMWLGGANVLPIGG